MSLKVHDDFGSGEVEENSTDSEDEVADDDRAEHSELSCDDGGQAESGMDSQQRTNTSGIVNFCRTSQGITRSLSSFQDRVPHTY